MSRFRKDKALLSINVSSTYVIKKLNEVRIPENLIKIFNNYICSHFFGNCNRVKSGNIQDETNHVILFIV